MAGRVRLMLVVIDGDMASNGRRRDKIVHPVWPRHHEQGTKHQQAPQCTSTAHTVAHNLCLHVAW